MDAVYRVSEWVKTGDADVNGHWKGKGSGSPTEFAEFIAILSTGPFRDSIFYEQFKDKKTHLLISSNLDVDSPAPANPPQIPYYDISGIFVRILLTLNPLFEQLQNMLKCDLEIIYIR
jgi:hypothetical protein